MKNRLPTISIKNTATDDSSMIITVMHFSGILFVKVLINNAPNISAHWKGNNERQGKAITFNPTIKVRVIYIYLHIMVSLTLFFLLNIHPFFIIYSFFIFHQSIGTGPFEKFCLHTEFPSCQPKNSVVFVAGPSTPIRQLLIISYKSKAIREFAHEMSFSRLCCYLASQS